MDLDRGLLIAKAMADRSRLLLLNALLERPHYVEELSERLGLAKSTVSFHLKKLEAAGLVSKRREQYYAVFHVASDALEMTLMDLARFECPERGRQQDRIDRYRERVLRAFFRDGRLVKLPAQHKKRRIVLEQLTALFEPGRTYREEEVNEAINQVFDDHCMVRRFLVDWRLMEREDGQYHLTPAAPEEERAPSEPGSMRGSRRRTGGHQERPERLSRQERARLKREYRETPRPMGVYRISNRESGRVLIGWSTDLAATLNSHRAKLTFPVSHPVRELQRDWDEYGEKAFLFEVIDTLEPTGSPGHDYREDLTLLAAMWRLKLGLTPELEYR